MWALPPPVSGRRPPRGPRGAGAAVTQLPPNGKRLSAETPADAQTVGSEEPLPPGSLRTGKCCWLYGLA